jgi:hypothetical protein
MQRIYTKNATGIAPDGRWYAGDINALQDAVAALNDLTQSLGIGTVAIGESGLQLLRFGPGEARVTGMLRTDGILRGLGGLIAGAFTTAQRDAIATGLAPYGILILNTTTNRYECNKGTDAARNWQPLGFVPAGGGLIADADIAAAAGIQISKLGGFPTDATKALWGDGTWHAPLTVPTVSGSNYTLLITDINKIVEMSAAGANTLTVPPNSAVAFPVGASITVSQYGAGQTSIVAGAGVTLRSYNNSLKIAGQYGVAGLIKRGTDEWYAAGNLVP